MAHILPNALSGNKKKNKNDTIGCDDVVFLVNEGIFVCIVLGAPVLFFLLY